MPPRKTEEDRRRLAGEFISYQLTTAVREAQKMGIARTPFIQWAQAIWSQEAGEPWGVILSKDEDNGEPDQE